MRIQIKKESLFMKNTDKFTPLSNIEIEIKCEKCKLPRIHYFTYLDIYHTNTLIKQYLMPFMWQLHSQRLHKNTQRHGQECSSKVLNFKQSTDAIESLQLCNRNHARFKQKHAKKAAEVFSCFQSLEGSFTTLRNANSSIVKL